MGPSGHVCRAAIGSRVHGIRPRRGVTPGSLELPRPGRGTRGHRRPGGYVTDAAAARRQRMERVRVEMRRGGLDALLLSVGPDLPWLTGYTAMPLERLTMLVLPTDGPATMVVPVLEAPRVEVDPSLFELRPWPETEDPVDRVATLVRSCRQ